MICVEYDDPNACDLYIDPNTFPMQPSRWCHPITDHVIYIAHAPINMALGFNGLVVLRSLNPGNLHPIGVTLHHPDLYLPWQRDRLRIVPASVGRR